MSRAKRQVTEWGDLSAAQRERLFADAYPEDAALIVLMANPAPRTGRSRLARRHRRRQRLRARHHPPPAPSTSPTASSAATNERPRPPQGPAHPRPPHRPLPHREAPPMTARDTRRDRWSIPPDWAEWSFPTPWQLAMWIRALPADEAVEACETLVRDMETAFTCLATHETSKP